MNRVNLVFSAVVGAIGAAWVASRLETGDESLSIGEVPLLGAAVGFLDSALGGALNPDLQTMRSSSALRDMLKRRERLLLERTDLGDGGYTIGWGRFEKNADALPARVTRAEADAMFEEDIDRRAERWVRAYVRVPLSQERFDALTHMAYNLRPASFRTIAEAVNRGEAPDAEALRYVRAGSEFERGLRIRRAEELALYHSGVYS